MRIIASLALVVLVAGCALPPADQPAHPSRMGRFLGLVSRCGCSDIGGDRMLAEYGKVTARHYSEAQTKSMRGYVDLALSENFDNQLDICAEICSQGCMVNAVAIPLGGRPVAGAAACLVSERDLHLTTGQMGGDWD
ncbi:hypothetical protein [Magnetospirillum sulfuroxidans]|uniref:Lipoprotein n=1 Tax=Magnetospirillum sulfuroxidans TaxID=611300 RepID=A0ABS5I798_9PROT|nr:hypothetical protein [Magnetospirillum sulfuroxidans]MBR9970292.1 hypothetical protein [Magnetospirillum sulfuroxidans]